MSNELYRRFGTVQADNFIDADGEAVGSGGGGSGPVVLVDPGGDGEIDLAGLSAGGTATLVIEADQETGVRYLPAAAEDWFGARILILWPLGNRADAPIQCSVSCFQGMYVNSGSTSLGTAVEANTLAPRFQDIDNRAGAVELICVPGATGGGEEPATAQWKWWAPFTAHVRILTT